MENLTISALLDRARDSNDLKSDYQLGKRLGFSMQKLGNWRHGRTMPDEKACEKLAEVAGLDPDYVVAQVEAMRASDEKTRAIWQRIAARLSGAISASFLVILSAVFALSVGASDAYAASDAARKTSTNDDLSKIYIVGVLTVLLFWLLSGSGSAMVPAVTFPWVPAK